MVKTAFSKALQVGRATALALGVAVMLALVLGLASAAFGANGGNFILGKTNVATKITALGGKLGVDGPMLRLINNNAGANDTALDLKVQAGEAPMTVNRATKVANLNADLLDGQDSTAFLGANAKAADADRLDGQDSSQFVRNSTYRNESTLGPGTTLGDGTQTLSASCLSGDVMLSGGPANIAATTDIVESFPSGTNSWTARVDKNGQTDNYSVVVLCANQ